MSSSLTSGLKPSTACGSFLMIDHERHYALETAKQEKAILAIDRKLVREIAALNFRTSFIPVNSIPTASLFIAPKPISAHNLMGALPKLGGNKEFFSPVSSPASSRPVSPEVLQKLSIRAVVEVTLTTQTNKRIISKTSRVQFRADVVRRAPSTKKKAAGKGRSYEIIESTEMEKKIYARLSKSYLDSFLVMALAGQITTHKKYSAKETIGYPRNLVPQIAKERKSKQRSIKEEAKRLYTEEEVCQKARFLDSTRFTTKEGLQRYILFKQPPHDTSLSDIIAYQIDMMAKGFFNQMTNPTSVANIKERMLKGQRLRHPNIFPL
ncbi:MAG: hypothetical protein HN411_01590 [Waddliaceae bacterium]|jgi:hypothetical protein|nr:hypothetical protein [Waddliaceae bacterium]MBT6927981.1 hypothetical protein [Waddliaceae bacterium]MBT7263904.1 hypothetical protein [Waddliaceae bacterium]